MQVAEVVETEPNLGCEKRGVGFARRHRPVADVRETGRETLDDRMTADRRVVALVPEVDRVTAAGELLDDRFDVAVVPLVQRREQDLHSAVKSACSCTASRLPVASNTSRTS